MVEYPTQNLSDRQLKFSYWYVSNKLTIRRSVIGLLSLLNLWFWIYVIWVMTVYLQNYQLDQYLIQQMIFKPDLNYSQVMASRPLPIQVSDVMLLNREGGQYEYMVQVSNPNPDWITTFDYQFHTNAGTAFSRTAYILPGQDRILLDSQFGRQVESFSISNQQWEKLNMVEEIKNNRYRFSVAEEEFITGTEPGDPNRVKFQITNESAFSYWSVEVKVFLVSSGQIISGNTIVLDQFKAGETRDVELHWNIRLPRINRLDIIPEVNIFNEDNIMNPEAIYFRR